MSKNSVWLLACAILLIPPSLGHGADFFVSPSGNDTSAGSKEAPFQTLQHARDMARSVPKPVIIHMGDGIYYLPDTLVFSSEDSGVTWQAVDGAKPIISGGKKLELHWKPYQNGIMQADVPTDLVTEELFVNGERQILARYPNYDPNAPYFDGYAADAISPKRVARWADPAGGYFHAMHPSLWGDFTWLITGKDANGKLTMEGGWQNNRGGAMHNTIRFVENIFEELDAPGEWFLNRKTHVLYFFPPAGLDLNSAKIEVTELTTLIEFQGSKQKPVRSVSLKGLTFRQANRTVMETKEPLVRSDWAIARKGAIVFNGAENCSLIDSLIDQVGGNVVFVNNYNRQITIQGCEIVKSGASGIVFLGDPTAVRNPLFNYDQHQSYAEIDKTPGPKTDNYPSDCLVDDCLIHLTGRVEKQTAGVDIDLAQNITVRHCSIYDMPRSGINIGDGCWGGNVVEYCDVFDTVKETGDHGSFNAWARDRYWSLKNAPEGELAQLSLLDAVKPNILRNSRWRCDHGWDIDLDDGSSNYEIYNNLCLNGGIKLREGFYRKVKNNIIVNNTLHPHVWFRNSEDEVYSNILMKSYRGVGVPSPNAKGKLVDRNLFFVNDVATKDRYQALGWDINSIVGDPLFIDPSKGNFNVAANSPAFGIGFVNFPMDQFGVQKPSLAAIARTPEIPVLDFKSSGLPQKKEDAFPHYWLGATLHGLEAEEYSAFGVAKDDGGIQLQNVPNSSPAAQSGLQKDDVIQKINDHKVSNLDDFFAALLAARTTSLNITLVRSQKSQTLTLEQAVITSTESTEDAQKFTKLVPPSTPSGTVTSNSPTSNSPLSVLVDGQIVQSYGSVFPNGITNGEYMMDLGVIKPVSAISSWSFNQNGNRGRQLVSILGSNSTANPGWDTNSSLFTPIGTIDTGTPIASFQGASLRAQPGKTLGSYRWIVWKVFPSGPHSENTAFQEFAVFPGTNDSK